MDLELNAAALQRRRLASSEPEDDEFLFRWWADLQFFIVALSRLRRYAEIALDVSSVRDELQDALATFDCAVPDLRKMRNVGEHGDAYAVNSSKRHMKSIDARQLESGMWNGKTYVWLNGQLDVDAALNAAEELFGAVKTMFVLRA